MRALWFVGLAACSFSPPPPASGVDDARPTTDGRPSGVDAPAASDGALGDAAIDAPFDPAIDCPGTYGLTVAATKSRYRVIDSDASWPQHNADCGDDLAGATHLVVFETSAEQQQIAQQASTQVYLVGYFQMAGSAAVDANWFSVTGDPAASQPVWLGGQPNDNDDNENGEQDRAFVNTPSGAAIQDGPASFMARGICECDGKPIPAAIAAML